MISRFLLTLLLIAASLSGAVRAESVVYVHTDVLGSPVLETNADGKVVRQVDYRAYGEEVMDSPRTGVGYTGHYRDAATGVSGYEIPRLNGESIRRRYSAA